MSLQLLCWECKQPIDDEGISVFMHPDRPWSQSMTTICQDCFELRCPEQWVALGVDTE